MSGRRKSRIYCRSRRPCDGCRLIDEGALSHRDGDGDTGNPASARKVHGCSGSIVFLVGHDGGEADGQRPSLCDARGGTACHQNGTAALKRDSNGGSLAGVKISRGLEGVPPRGVDLGMATVLPDETPPAIRMVLLSECEPRYGRGGRRPSRGPAAIWRSSGRIFRRHRSRTYHWSRRGRARGRLGAWSR